jgi:hypothetical protein
MCAKSNSSTRPNISGHQLRRIDHAHSHTTSLTQVLESISRSVCLGCTIAVRCSIGLSMEGFRISRSICIQVLSDALPLEGVPTRVTRVDNNVHFNTNCSSCVYASPTMDLCIERRIFVALKFQNTSLP